MSFKAVLFLLIASYRYLPLQVYFFLIYVLITNYLFLCLCSLPNRSSASYFKCFFPLTLCYSCLTLYSVIELQFSDSPYLSPCQTFMYFCLAFPECRATFNISCKPGLVNSLSFGLSGKAFISSSYLKDSFAAEIILGSFHLLVF